MIGNIRWRAFIGMLLALSFVPGSVLALETSSAVRGVVTDQAGNPVAGATVTVRNEGTSLTRQTETNASGEFSIRNLQVDDDYTISASASGHESARLEGVALSLGRVAAVTLAMQKSGPIEEVVVTARRVTSQVAVGPSATFGLRELETSPSINRNIADVLRIDPRIYVDESRGDINAIQCGGKNSRFNSLTVDGVRTNDSFGLNANGYPTERMPFSFDAINQVSVELAPFDASYGGFTACNINAVTKSGGNEFFGSFFYDYTNDDLRNDSLEGDSVETGDFTEKRYGITVGGPIVKDKLFFFAAYEELEGANLFDRGPIGSGAVNEVLVTQAELDEILQIARDIYQYDPGTIPNSADNEDEKLLVKLDWYINDNHRIALTYNYNDGFNISEADDENTEFEFSNHLYERGAELDSWVGTLYSDWTDNFSTQFRIGTLELDNRQISVGGTDFGEIRVELDDVDVYLGGDDSRQSNKLNYEVDTISLTGTYQLENHTISFGYEREALEVFNLFVQHTETEIRFDGIQNFRDGFADAIYYNNAPSNNPQDAAAEWGYEVNTLFVQDEFNLTDQLEVLVGLRYDWYTSDDKPLENAEFVADYGFSNSTNLDGEGLLQPRIGVTYFFNDQLTFRGGVGLYSGGDPNVWLSNNFSANNVLQFGQRGRSFGYTDGTRSLFAADVVYAGLEAGVPAGPGYGVPQELFDAVAGGTGDNFELNYLDPDFELPSEWKFSVGFTYLFENEYTLQADVLVTRGNDTAIVQRADLEFQPPADGPAFDADGYPNYVSARLPSFVLTNSSKGNESEVFSFSVSKFHDNGIDWRVGYSYTNAEDISPMTSSVAFSNYVNRAFFDPQEDRLSTSNYQIRHRFTAVLNWERAFFGDNMTRVSVYASANEGPPYSFAFDGTINPYGFTPFLDFQDNVLAPGDDRNDQEGSWWGKVDIRVEQEFGLGDFGKASAFLVIDNFTNLLNDEWGVLREVDFPNNVERGNSPESTVGDASRYEIRFGVKYAFNQ
ncbi:MAG: TonB-dependent receptor [Pseudomonadota bacterium]